ncbi:MAG TPA: gamma-glutamyltransferase [Candidatus Binataceae bacterium]|nr:gamma-glutamyltransferase [Candidatus Binataceae bacterium]
MMESSQLQIAKTELHVENGCVVAAQPLAAQAGAQILADGGNAVDAAVATAFALAVVEPMMSGLGGGGALLVDLANGGGQHGIDFHPRAPMAASPSMFALDRARSSVGMYGWPAVVDDANLLGHRAAGVPGAVAGLCRALEKWGRLSLAQVMAPAIELAQEGFEPDWFLSAMVAADGREIRRWPALAQVFLPDGLPPPARIRSYLAAPRLRQPDLARTLHRIASQGAAEFYHGETAQLIVDEMARRGGLLGRADLAAYRPIEYDGLREVSYRQITISSIPSPNGATTMLQALNLLEGFDLAGEGFLSAAALHLIAEAQRLAFADRFAHLTDPAVAAVPLDGLLSKQYAAQRRRLIDPRRAAAHPMPGDPWPFDPHGGTLGANPSGREREGGHTTHLCVVDRERNMVSLTNTLLDLWGSHVMVERTGVLLNDAMAWFDPLPNRINSIASGKRPLWAGSPVLARRDNRPWLALGAPGGRRIISAVLQVLLNLIDYQRGPQDAVAAPRIHAEGATLELDSRLHAQAAAHLRALGHQVQQSEESFLVANFARPVAITIEPTHPQLRSGVDVLRPATAVGF